MAKLVSLARDLRRRKARERDGLFVGEGVRVAEELLRAGVAVRGVLVSPTLDTAPRGRELRAAFEARGVPVTDVSDKDFGSAADTESPQGVLVIAEVPHLAMPEPTGPTRVLVLDAVQDPGNAGALLRTAAGLGVTATVVLPGTVDPWNAKVVRAAVGAQCHHPVVPMTCESLITWCHAHAVPLWGADHRGESLATVTLATEAEGRAVPSSLALAMGNEGGGLTDAVRNACDRLVAIPITPAVESLNVGVAAGILLWALRA
jgi:RNA methyltransferase, TrmH family